MAPPRSHPPAATRCLGVASLWPLSSACILEVLAISTSHSPLRPLLNLGLHAEVSRTHRVKFLSAVFLASN